MAEDSAEPDSDAGSGDEFVGAGQGGGGQDERERAARARERRWLWWTAAGFVVVVLAGGAAGALSGSSGAGLSPEALLVVAGMMLGFVLVCGGVGFGFALWRRRRGSPTFARSPLWELPRLRQRSALQRDLRRGRAIAPDQRDLALRVARDIIRRRNLVWLYLVLAVVQGVNAALQDSDWTRWLLLVSSVFFAAAALWFAYLISRMRRAAARLQPELPAGQHPVDGP